MRRWSPYTYAFNNPIRFIDIDGMAPGDSTKSKIVPIPISQRLMPNIYENVVQGIAAGQPVLLTYDSDKKKKVQRRNAALKGHAPAKLGNSLDEYPFASTKQGGAGASVKEVPATEQSIQGGIIGGAVISNKMQTGDQFLVVPIPDASNPTNNPVTVTDPKTSPEPGNPVPLIFVPQPSVTPGGRAIPALAGFAANPFVIGFGFVLSVPFLAEKLAPEEYKREKSTSPIFDACFRKGTLVYSKNGSVPIEKIKVGDIVFSYDIAAEKEELDTVSKVMQRTTVNELYEIKTDIQSIFVTQEHPFFVKGKGWIKVKDLIVGDTLKTISNKKIIIHSIKKILTEESVYNFEVKKNHNYFVTPEIILVHNKKINTNRVTEKLNDMSDTSKVLEAFGKCLEKYNLPTYMKLEDGLKSEWINKSLKEVSIVNNELNNLYQWRDGIKNDTSIRVGEFDFSSFGKMLSLNDAIAHYKSSIADSLWKDNYFPILTTHGGDYVLYDIDANSKTYGMLLLYSPSLLITEPEPVYDSMQSFLETVISCYEHGAYKLDPKNNSLDIDIDLEYDISKGKNPKSDYWKN